MNNDNSSTSAPISLETLPQLNDADLVILLGCNFSDLKQLDSMERFEDHQLSKLKQAWEKKAIAQSLDASQAGRVYFIPTYLCAGLPGPIGAELYLNELKQNVQAIAASGMKYELAGVLESLGQLRSQPPPLVRGQN